MINKLQGDNMSNDLYSDFNVEKLTQTDTIESSLVRFEDVTDKHVPTLNYSVPLPSTYPGKLFLALDFPSSYFKSKRSYLDKLRDNYLDKLTLEIKNIADSVKDVHIDLEFKENIDIDDIKNKVQELSGVNKDNTASYEHAAYSYDDISISSESIYSSLYQSKLWDINDSGNIVLKKDDVTLPLSYVMSQAERGIHYQVAQRYQGNEQLIEVDTRGPENPRIVIVEHYRMSSLFEDYGAGRTVNTFSLWPGEETKIYIRTWSHSESKKAERSSIFDSYTIESANEFQQSMEDESSRKTTSEEESSWRAAAKAGGGLFGWTAEVSGGGSGSSRSSREEFSKTVGKASQSHSAKASSKRDTNIETSLEETTALENETINERTIRNTNLSRVLNIVARELNQEFNTYLSLVDVSIAFVNDWGVFEEVPLAEMYQLLKKHMTSSKIEDAAKTIIDELQTIVDYQGSVKSLIEFVDIKDHSHGGYWRVKTPQGGVNPFYEKENVPPVDGIVTKVVNNVVKTDSVIIDALLGHGVALDQYSLASQQEALREKQNENKKLELALTIIENNEPEKAKLFRELFHETLSLEEV